MDELQSTTDLIPLRYTILKRFGYGLGHIFNDMCAAMGFTYSLIFFQKVLGFNSFFAGIFMAIGQLADGIATVLVGVLSDKKDLFKCFIRFGNRNSWHLMGTVCVAIAFPFIFMPCINCENESQEIKLVYYSGFSLILMFGFASVQISHLAMIPELAATSNEKTLLTSIRYAGTILSTILVYVFMWCWLGIDKDSSTFGPDDASIFRDVTLLTLGVGVFCSFLFHVIMIYQKTISNDYDSDLSENENQRECNNTTNSDEQYERNEVDEISFSLPEIATIEETQMTVINWLCEPQLYQVALLYMSSRLFVNISQAYMPLYLNICLEQPATYVAIIPMIMYISGIFVAVITKTSAKFLGIKMTTAIYSIMGLIGCLWMHWGSKDDSTFKNIEIYFIAISIGSGGSGMLITSLSITAQLIGKNVESSAFVYGAISFVDKLSSGLAIMLIQHFTPNEDSSNTTPHLQQKYYGNIMVWACGSFALAVLIIISSTASVQIGRLRKQRAISDIPPEDKVCLTHNMEADPIET